MNDKIFVVIPAYNEGRVISSTLGKFRNRAYNIVVVDDGSSDNTWQEIQKFNIFALKHPVNIGQGAALQTGIDFSLKKNAQVIITFDADGQHDENDIEAFSKLLIESKSDVVLGTRFKRKVDIKSIPFLKRNMLRLAIFINNLITGMKLSDAHNGFRAFTHDGAAKIYITESGYAHATEIISQIKHNNLKYIEAPTHIVYNEYSKSKGQSIWNGLTILFDLFKSYITK